jgi:hypothetical protein
MLKYVFNIMFESEIETFALQMYLKMCNSVFVLNRQNEVTYFGHFQPKNVKYLAFLRTFRYICLKYKY